MTLRHYVDRANVYVNEHNRTFKRGLLIIGGCIVVVLLISLYVYNTERKTPKIVYTPMVACTVFTKQEAQSLLGSDVLGGSAGDPTVTDNRATSKCSYTDMNASSMSVAAVAVRSAINDDGIEANKKDFAASKAANATQPVAGIGDQAFYVPANGQLNVLDGHSWILITYGTGNDQSTYTLDNAMKVAHKVIETTT